MNSRRFRRSLIAMLAALSSCSSLPALRGGADGPGTIETVWIHVNDVYELMALEGGRSGGLARLAGLDARLRERNPNTTMLLAGDFFSPSAIGTAKVDGRPLFGRQIVDVLGAAGLDLATFGNHEFDIPEEDFRLRLSEARFDWVSSNVLDARSGRPYPGVPVRRVIVLRDDDGDAVRVGIFSVTIDSSRKPYVAYSDAVEAARREVKALRDEDRADVVIALTHQTIAQDRELLAKVEGIDLLMGGHEHVHMAVPVMAPSGRTVTAYKADANAKSAWIHVLRWDAKARRANFESALQEIDESTPELEPVAERAAGWIERAHQGFRSGGFEPTRRVMQVRETLEGREEFIRREATNLMQLVSRGMLHGVPGADYSIFNSGMIRIDDVVEPGFLTEYDVLRIAPFEDHIVSARIRGRALLALAGHSELIRGGGMYLQIHPVLNPESIDPEREYGVALNRYLLERIQAGFGGLSLKESFLETKIGRDLRLVLIDYWKTL